MKISINKGFTLLEILLVIAAIGILASIVIVAINPLRQLSKAENASRWSNINTIQKALDQYYIANGKYPDEVPSGSYEEVCDTGGESVGGDTDCITTGKIDLRVLVPAYIAEIPRDPNGGGYKVGINPLNNQISVWADKAKLEDFIVINPMELALVIGGTNEVGQELSIDLVANGLENIDPNNIIWYRGTTPVGTGERYTVGVGDVGSEITAKVVLGGTDFASGSGGNVGTVSLSITGTNQVGQTLSAVVSGMTVNPSDIIWYTVDGAVETQVGTGANYTVQSGDAGKEIIAKVIVTGQTLASGSSGIVSNPITTFAKKAGGSSNEYSTGVANYSDGSSVITGYFSGTTSFGEGGFIVSLVSSGNEDVFIAKYDNIGDLVWAKKAGGSSREYGRGIASYSDGSSIITGSFSGTITFGEGGNQVSLVSSNEDIFIAKYDNTGNLVWAKKAGGTGYDYGQGISSYSNGNSVITGFFSDTVIFGEGGNQVSLVSSGSYDTFIAKYDVNGNLILAKKAGGTNIDYGRGIASYSDGGIVITGNFSGTAIFGEGGNQVSLVSSGNEDAFIAKYDNTGNLVWAKKGGGTNSDYGKTIASYSDGGIIMCGDFQQTFTIGEGGNQVNLTSAGIQDIFIAKYDNIGNLVWAKRAGGTDNEYGRGIASYSDGSSIVTGYFTGTAIFGEGGNQVSLPYAGIHDIFIAKYDNIGNLVWAKRAGGTGNDYGSGIASYSDGSSIITGNFSGTAIFGEGGNQVSLVSSNDDVFIVQYNANGTLEP